MAKSAPEKREKLRTTGISILPQTLFVLQRSLRPDTIESCLTLVEHSTRYSHNVEFDHRTGSESGSNDLVEEFRRRSAEHLPRRTAISLIPNDATRMPLSRTIK